MCIKGLPCQADSMSENVWLNAHSCCTRKKWFDKNLTPAEDIHLLLKTGVVSRISTNRYFLTSTVHPPITWWFREQMPTLFLEVGNYRPYLCFFRFHLQVWEFSEISSEDKWLKALNKKKLKALASKKSFSLPKFQVPDVLFFTLSPLPPLEPRTETPTRLLHGLHTKVHRTGDFLTYTRAVIKKPGAVTWTIESWLVHRDPYKFLIK